jgi:hypothetical protein
MSDIQKEITIAACPCCNGEAILKYEDKYYQAHPFIECGTCYLRSDHESTKGFAIAAWNTRHVDEKEPVQPQEPSAVKDRQKTMEYNILVQENRKLVEENESLREAWDFVKSEGIRIYWCAIGQWECEQSSKIWSGYSSPLAAIQAARAALAKKGES